MIKKVKEPLLMIKENSGEVEFRINTGESYNIRSREQTLLDENYSPREKLYIGRFIKVMSKEIDVINCLKNSPMTYLLINHLKHYAEYNSNLIKKNGKKYKLCEIAQDIGLTRQMVRIHINRLKKLNLLAELELKGKFLVINPYFYFNGTEIPKNILNLFSDKLAE